MNEHQIGLGAAMVKSKCAADGSIMSLEDCLELKGRPIPCCENPIRGTGHPLASPRRKAAQTTPQQNEMK